MLNEDLQKRVLSLKAKERIDLVDFILESLDNPDFKIQKNWVKESEKRYDAYKAGKIKSVSYEEVMKQLLK